MKTPIDKLMDAQYLTRWSMVGTDKEQNVAAHSFNVAMLAMEIRKRMFNTIAISEQEVCYYALIHDVREVYTGDIPTPTKAKMKAMGFDPDGIDPDCPDEAEPTATVAQIVRAADLIDCYVFIAEHAVGTRGRGAISEVSGRLREYLAGISEDMRRAAVETMSYVQQRKSESDEERRRFKEDRERFAGMREAYATSNIMG